MAFFDQQVAQAKLNKFGTNHANAAVLMYQQHRKKILWSGGKGTLTRTHIYI